MGEYVEKDEVLDRLYEEGEWTESISHTVYAMPAADVVPVVRCEDCSYSLEDGFWCMGCGLMPEHATLPNKWCDEGERYYSGARMDGESK